MQSGEWWGWEGGKVGLWISGWEGGEWLPLIRDMGRWLKYGRKVGVLVCMFGG